MIVIFGFQVQTLSTVAQKRQTNVFRWLANSAYVFELGGRLDIEGGSVGRVAEQHLLCANRSGGADLRTDCAMNMQGFANMLLLRAEIEGQWGGGAPAPGQYIDMSFYERALKQATP